MNRYAVASAMSDSYLSLRSRNPLYQLLLPSPATITIADGAKPRPSATSEKKSSSVRLLTVNASQTVLSANGSSRRTPPSPAAPLTGSLENRRWSGMLLNIELGAPAGPSTCTRRCSETETGCVVVATTTSSS